MERVLVSIDARGGRGPIQAGPRAAATAGDLIGELVDAACAASSTRRSRPTGCSRAPSSTGLQAIADVAAESNAELIYSGGIGSPDDLAELAALGLPGLTGVIVGRALYEGRFTVAEGQAALDAGDVTS